MKWPWRRAEDTSGEAIEQLRRLERNDGEVAKLAEELIDVQRRNNFSRMVDVAISRRRLREDGGG